MATTSSIDLPSPPADTATTDEDARVAWTLTLGRRDIAVFIGGCLIALVAIAALAVR